METTSAVVIATGVGMAIYDFARAFALRRPEVYGDARQTLARYWHSLSSCNSAQISSRPPIAPSSDQIGKLGAIGKS